VLINQKRSGVNSVKVLVTGAAGFIGSKVSESLVKSGHSVTALDNFNDYYSSDLKRARVNSLLAPTGLEVLDCDISERGLVQQIIGTNQPEVILHFAAQAGVRLPNDQISKYVDSNLVGFSNVLQSAVQAGIPKLVYASSSSVYGNSVNFPFSEKDLSIRPISFYGATKLANELLAPTLIKNSETRARGLRFFTVYGPWGRPDMAYFRLINAAQNKSQFHMFGDGSVIRDFTYVDDVVNSISQLVVDLDSRSGGFHDVVNVAGGKPASLRQMIEEISKQLGEKIPINKSEMHANDVNSTAADTSYLSSLTTRIPSTSLEEGISRVIEWAKQPSVQPHLKAWVDSSI